MFFSYSHIYKLFSCFCPSFSIKSHYSWSSRAYCNQCRIFLHFFKQIFPCEIRICFFIIRFINFNFPCEHCHTQVVLMHERT